MKEPKLKSELLTDGYRLVGNLGSPVSCSCHDFSWFTEILYYYISYCVEIIQQHNTILFHKF